MALERASRESEACSSVMCCSTKSLPALIFFLQSAFCSMPLCSPSTVSDDWIAAVAVASAVTTAESDEGSKVTLPSCSTPATQPQISAWSSSEMPCIAIAATTSL